MKNVQWGHVPPPTIVGTENLESRSFALSKPERTLLASFSSTCAALNDSTTKKSDITGNALSEKENGAQCIGRSDKTEV